MNNFTATAISFFLLLLVLRREAPYSLCYFHCFSIEYLQAEQAGNEACPAKRCTRTLLNPLETSATDASPNVTRADCTAPAFFDSLARARLPRNPNGFSVVFICFSRQELHASNNELDDDNIIVEIARPASVLAALKRACILGKRP